MSWVAAMSECDVSLGWTAASAPAAARRRVVAVTGWVGVCALVVVAPFEMTRPLVRLPGQSLSNVEAVLVAVVGLWAAAALALRIAPAWRSPLTLPWVVLVGASAVAALAAPADRTNALHMAARFGLAFSVFLLTVSSVTSPSRLRTLLRLTVISGVVVALLAVLEYAGVVWVLDGLKRFRPSVALVGAQVRAGGPLQYPTIASMWLELCFAFGLGLLAHAVVERRWWVSAALMAALGLVGEGIVLTFTRAGLLTAATSLIIVAGVSLWRGRTGAPVAAIALVAVVLVLEVTASRSSEAMRVRLTSEGQEHWFRATVHAPEKISMSTGGVVNVPVRFTNTGGVTWDPAEDHPFLFSYHWLEANSDLVVDWEGLRTALPWAVRPGQAVDVTVSVRAPGEPGDYRLLWDVEQQDRLWFSIEPGAVAAHTHAVVDGPVVRQSWTPRPMVMPSAAVRPGRMTLWAAALRMLADHPWTGVGPDNVRLRLASVAGLPGADRRVHSNNMYLELLAGSGLLGGLALAWFVWRACGVGLTLVRVAEPSLGTGLAAALTAIAVHGVVDSFLGFTPTYVLIAITIGLAATAVGSLEAHAHRV